MSEKRRKRKGKSENKELKKLRGVLRSYNIEPALFRAAVVLRKGVNYIIVGDTRKGDVYCFGSLSVLDAERETEKAANEWNFCPECKRFWKPL